MPRPPKYDWEDKRDICYKLWVSNKAVEPILTSFWKMLNLEHLRLRRKILP